MLTRLKIDGFKNLINTDVSFGPFTCVAGPNGIGKSNLFDAIIFIGALADRPLMDAALSVRSEGGRAVDPGAIFRRQGNEVVPHMSFEVEMIIPAEGEDDLGQQAKAAITFLRYGLVLENRNGEIAIREESLGYIPLSQAPGHLRFPNSRKWRESAVHGRRSTPFISTEEGQVKLHLDMGEGYKGGGRPRSYRAERLPRTVLSDANAAEHRTAVLARREMQSWKLLQLEPSALRSPDPYTAPRSVASNGAHMPATLARLGGLVPHRGDDRRSDADVEYARLANRLSELIEGVDSISVDADDRRELLTLVLTDDTKAVHDARSLSDGTLRFLALAILESDPEARGVLCLEEPENGIHPERIPAMLRLLKDIAVDSTLPVNADNPLRQVIVNTHSPAVVAEVDENDLLMAMVRYLPAGDGVGHRMVRSPEFRALERTWRLPDGGSAIPRGLVERLLNPTLKPEPSANVEFRRVIDREELQRPLPFR